jgi:hypothetical protein
MLRCDHTSRGEDALAAARRHRSRPHWAVTKPARIPYPRASTVAGLVPE